MTRTTDVAVIGAGALGCSIALELRRAGYDVTVIDRGSAPGTGSSAASSAVVRFNYPTWDGVAASWESFHRWERWRDYLQLPVQECVTEYRRTGLAFLDVDLLPGEAMAQHFDTASIPYEIWDSARLRSAVPGIDPGRYFPPKPVETDAFFDDAESSLGAVYTPDAGFVEDPQGAVLDLARAAEQIGAELMLGSPVVAIDKTGPGWRLTLASGDVVDSRLVVNAAGPWSSSLNAMAGVGADFEVTVRPMRQEVHHVSAPSSLGGDTPIIADADLGTYIRSDRSGHLLIGGTEPECDPWEWVDDPDSIRTNPTVPVHRAQVTRAARRLPDLTVPNVPRGVVGVYDVSSDWTPIYDRTDADGYYVAMGTSGNQFKNAPLVGSLMAAIMQGVDTGHDHDTTPVEYVCPFTGLTIDTGVFSRRRTPTAGSTGTVFG